jgi:hypothetical protein
MGTIALDNSGHPYIADIAHWAADAAASHAAASIDGANAGATITENHTAPLIMIPGIN